MATGLRATVKTVDHLPEPKVGAPVLDPTVEPHATVATVEELVSVITQALASDAVRGNWLERLFVAIQDDDPPFGRSSITSGFYRVGTPARAHYLW